MGIAHPVLTPLKVYLVDDSDGIRDRFSDMLQKITGVTIVGGSASANSAITGILATRPDVVLLDMQLEGGTGVDVLKAVHTLEPGIVFIVLTNHGMPAYARASMLHGASYFLDKSRDFEALVRIVSGLRDKQRLA